MAVTTKSESNSENSVEEPVQHSGGEGADPGSGPSARPKVILPKSIRKVDSEVVRSHKLGGNRIKDNKSDRLSDIDDLELVGYLRTKEEMHLKRILWEAMNEGYIKGGADYFTIEENHLNEAKKQKQAAEKKKGVSVKKAPENTEKAEPERHSSRINYGALKSLNDELKSCESDQTTGPGSYLHGSQHSPNGKSSHEMHGSNESWYEENQHDDETFGENENETHCQYLNEDYEDFNDYFDS